MSMSLNFLVQISSRSSKKLHNSKTEISKTILMSTLKKHQFYYTPHVGKACSMRDNTKVTKGVFIFAGDNHWLRSKRWLRCFKSSVIWLSKVRFCWSVIPNDFIEALISMTLQTFLLRIKGGVYVQLPEGVHEFSSFSSVQLVGRKRFFTCTE